jgi:hypothetical protein
MPQGNCKSNKLSNVTVELICDINSEIKLINIGEFDSQKCDNILKFNTKYACKTKKYNPWYKIKDISYSLISIICGIFGIFFMVQGYNFYTFGGIAHFTVFLAFQFNYGDEFYIVF